MRTAREWIDWASRRFERAGLHYGHGTDNSFDEACWLVLHAMGKPVQAALQDWDEIPAPHVAAEIGRLVEQRIEKRLPAAYLVGTAWFAGLEFEVTPDVLVPRSPLAELIAEGFRPWIDPESVSAILDLGTGSGCIAVACAVHFPNAQVWASDISTAALEIARRNISRHHLEKQVRAVHSDLFDALGEDKYDLIVSNPPYVPAARVGRLPAEYRSEPELGLVSGTDGLEIPLRILSDAAHHLRRGGILVCEVGESRERLQEALPGVPFTWLEFEHGGDGVFLLDYEELEDAAEAAAQCIRER